jgi:hypothetical protein
VNGDGITLTDAEHGIQFDLNADGIAEKLAWTSPDSDDSWLVLDRNENGSIDNGIEMFSNFAPQQRIPGKPPNGFLALAEFDKPNNGGNDDGRIDQQDAVSSKLRLWRDANHNGKVDQGELVSLGQAGILGFDLAYRESHAADQFGNAFRYRAKVYHERGEHPGRWAFDVFLLRSVP